MEIKALLERLTLRSGRPKEEFFLYSITKLTDELPGVDHEVKAALADQLSRDSGCLPPGAMRHLRALTRMTLKEINQALEDAAHLFGGGKAAACKKPRRPVSQAGR